jgi:hypothetical protein
MALMRPLDPAPSVALPGDGWELIATEAGRYAAGLTATFQARNGGLQAQRQLPLAHPDKWTPFVQEVAEWSGCDPEAVILAIRELTDAIEVLLRPPQDSTSSAQDRNHQGRPQARLRVRVNTRFLRDIVTDAVAALVAVNEPPTLFMRGSELVRVPPAEAHAEPLSIPKLRVFLDHAADFVWVDVTEGGGEKEIPDRPPRDVCESILAVPPANDFPELVSIRSAPVLLPDGRLLATDGYDGDSGLLLRLRGLEDIRTDMPVEEARTWLFDELFGDFPFVDDASRAHTLALVLEPFVRPTIHGPTPLYLIDAPLRGAGKGLLADAACVVSTGRKADVMALVSGNAEEHEKRITALLLAGAQWILIDNATSLASAPLAAVLTATQWRGRRLGKSEMVDVPNDATWVATGNNVELSDEIARRTIPIRLDPGVERPENRTGFSHPELVKWAGEHRSTLVSACLSLVGAWLDAGCSEGQITLGSYESWARILGGVLGVSGVSGFLSGRERLYSEADRETADWRALCEAWWEAHADHAITAKDVFEVAKKRGLLLHVWAGRSDLGAQQRFGHALPSVRDRVFGRFTVRSAASESATRNAAYRLEWTPQKTPKTPKTPGTQGPDQQPDVRDAMSGTALTGVSEGIAGGTSLPDNSENAHASRLPDPVRGVLGVLGVLRPPHTASPRTGDDTPEATHPPDDWEEI